MARMVEHADELVAGMEHARDVLGVSHAPDPEWAAALTERAAAAGINLTFHQALDDSGRVVHEARIDTGRGVIRRAPAENDSWQAALADVLDWL